MKRTFRQRLASAAIDTTALRASADFRRVFLGQLVSSIGTQVTLFTLMFQVYDLTESTAKVGLLGLVMVLPTLCLSLAGGAIADAMDRRKLLVLVQVALFSTSAALALLTWMGDPPLWTLYVLAALTSSFAAVDGPTRTAVVPMLVDPAHLRSAIQLREVLTQSGRVAGPMVAGLLIGGLGIWEAYALDALSLLFAFVVFLGLPALVPTTRRKFELSSITEGLHFVGKRPVLAASFWADIVAMVFGQQRALYPAYAATVFHVGPLGVGMMGAAPAAGAVIGLAFMGLTRHVQREGLAVLVCVSAWGACIALFALSPWFWLALVFLAFAGAADMVSAIFRQTILLTTVPDELRGRMGAVHIMVVTGGPPIGDALSGTTAEVIGVRPTSLVGGLAVIGGMFALAARIPAFVTWRDPTRVHEERLDTT